MQQQLLLVLILSFVCNGFSLNLRPPTLHRHALQSDTTPTRLLAYIKPESETPTAKKKKPFLYPKVGDVVRYYDLDGGKSKGELLVGKISFIQPDLGVENGWKVEINEMEDLGEGYYADYSGRKRLSKKSLRDLPAVSPVAASFVRSEGAFKIPMSADGVPIPRQETYDVEGYEGPFSGEFAVDGNVVAADGVIYDDLKGKLLRYVGIAGLAGTLVADLVKGTEDAIIYAGGALASLVYVLFLSLKTDTIAKDGSKSGSNISNLRFLTPVIIVAAVAVYNKSLGEANPAASDNTFSLVTTEQFASAILGFLTYRIPLFAIQIQEAFKGESGEVNLPGSAGVALKLAQQAQEEEAIDEANDLVTVLLVSGPQATGRSELVRELVDHSDGTLVEPSLLDRESDGAKFERLEQRDELLSTDVTGRYGLSSEGIVAAAGTEKDGVVVIDADVDVAKRLTKVPGIRIVGVWVGLSNMSEFESRLEKMIDGGSIAVPKDDTKESVLRARIRDIVQEIEYGISSGVFEFTILNEDTKNSLDELKKAASYCLK